MQVRHVFGGPCAEHVGEDVPLGRFQHLLEPFPVLGKESEGSDLLPEFVGVDPGERAVVRERAEYGLEGLVYHPGERLLDGLVVGQEHRIGGRHPLRPL